MKLGSLVFLRREIHLRNTRRGSAFGAKMSRSCALLVLWIDDTSHHRNPSYALLDGKGKICYVKVSSVANETLEEIP